MTLPLLLSVPHGGHRVPPEVADACVLEDAQLLADGDEGAARIYDLAPHVQAFVTTDVARAIVDLNRAPDDFRPDGVVKTETCFQEPVYREFPSRETVALLLEHYYHPYHQRLSEAAPRVVLGMDCHTMLAVGPPIGPGPGIERPALCLSNADGTCPEPWLRSVADCLARAFGVEVSLNAPFRGGYTIRHHAAELPWLQLEMSRAPFLTIPEKRRCVLAALTEWCELHAAGRAGG